MLTHIHPCMVSLPTGSSWSDVVRHCVRLRTRPPGAQSPFAQLRVLPACCKVVWRLSGRITLPSLLIRAHAPDQTPPADFGFRLIPTLALRVFPWMLGPVPRRSREVHVLVSSLTTSAFPEKRERVGDHKIIRSATSERGPFSRPLSFLTFWPPSLLATPVAPTAVILTGQPWRLRPSRTHVVAFMCIGYASRPIPSN